MLISFEPPPDKGEEFYWEDAKVVPRVGDYVDGPTSSGFVHTFVVRSVNWSSAEDVHIILIVSDAVVPQCANSVVMTSATGTSKNWVVCTLNIGHTGNHSGFFNGSVESW